MKKSVLFFTVAFLFGSIVLFAQDSTEEYLQNLEGPSAEDYIKLLYEGTHENQVLAVKKLREIGARGDEVIEALIFGLHQGTFYVKRKYNKVVNDFWDVRAMSAEALGEIADIDDARVLYELHMALRFDPEPIVRSSVAVGLGKMGQKKSVYHLVRAIETSRSSGSEDVLVRAAVEAIGEIGAREGLLPLIEVMRGNFRRSIKLAARDALKKIEW